jgi:CHRD domain
MMMRRALLIIALISALTVGAGVVLAAPGQTTSVSATLNAKQEVPPQRFKAATASGRFSATLTKTKKGYRMSWKLTFSKLSGKALFAHIHRGKPGKHGAALFSLCSSCGSGAHGSAYASPGEVNLMRAGQTYVTVRTKRNPAGEIRGQIRVG